MPGIYIHIPFCKQACHYCNFHFSTTLHLKKELVACIKKELVERVDFLKDQAVHTIYLGGGTPSILSLKEIEKLLESVRSTYRIAPDIEITIEVNPEDCSGEKVRGLKSMGINRLSLGIQSFHSEDLKLMNRAHDEREAFKAVETVRACDFESYSVDLMFGLVHSDMQKWMYNVDQVLQFEVPHISCYNLTVEEQTAYHHWQKKGTLSLPSDDLQNQQFYAASRRLKASGYDHYEISNYARPGHASTHNKNYWRREAYLGIGPSAHSFDGTKRYWNVASNSGYIKGINDGSEIWEEESLKWHDHLNEITMLGLRTARGILKEDLKGLPEKLYNTWLETMNGYTGQKVVDETEHAYVLAENQWHLADFVSSDLFCTS